MNKEHYLTKVNSHPDISKAEIIGSNIIAYSVVKEKQQLEWELICAVYDAEYNKNINQIIVK